MCARHVPVLCCVLGRRLGLSCSLVSCVNCGVTGRSRSGWTCSSSAGKWLVGALCDAAAAAAAASATSAAACLEENNLCRGPCVFSGTHTQQDIIRAAPARAVGFRSTPSVSAPGHVCTFATAPAHALTQASCACTHTRNSSCPCTCPDCRHLAQQAAGLHPVVVRYDPCVAVTAGLRRPGRFARFLSSQPDLMRPEVRCTWVVAAV